MAEKVRVASPAHWLFGAAPVIRGEDRSAYSECHARISAAVKCQDFLMEILVNDLVNLTWDTIRYRRAKADFLSFALYRAIQDEFNGDDAVAQKWARQDPDDIEEIEKALATIGLSIDALLARVHVEELEKVERLDRLIASADARRNAAFRELERHRANLARVLRDASNDVVDGKFEDVKTQPSARKLTA
jgi:hypothetical protein